jgi:hypothetical protein
VGDFRRFANARQLMAYLGLLPSEHSSGSTIGRGGITKAGNTLARRVLIEGAWTYRMTARVSRKLHDRLEPLSAAIRDIAWKAQVRLCAISAPGRSRQAEGRGHHRDRPRDGRLHLDNRPSRPASGRRPARSASVRSAAMLTALQSPVDLPLRLDDADASPTTPQGRPQ